jgi:Cu(I)/Ag(I) efflux system membrane protein CusA/SilA
VIEGVIGWSTRHSRLVLAAALLVGVGGEGARRRLKHDVIPDLSDPQVVLIAEWMGHPATEVAEKLTSVITAAMQDVPGATAVRGTSMSGMAYVDVAFRAAENLAAGRAAIAARAASVRARLPDSVRLTIGPEASATGWVFQYALVAPALAQTMGAAVDPFSPLSMLSLRRFQDDVMVPALSGIPGVAEVASVGGQVEQLLVEAQPERLRTTGVALSDLAAAVRQALTGREVRSDPRPVSVLQRAPIALPCAGRPGCPSLTVQEVARVRLAAEMAGAVADFGGFVETVGGIVVARRDADVSAVVAQVKAALDRMRPRLPKGVDLQIVYDRSALSARVEHTLLRALLEEVLVVVAVVLVFLLHGRSALVPLMTLPLVVALTFTGMWLFGVQATVMSLGGIGIALGMAVDADVVALEACHRRLESTPSAHGPSRRATELIAAAGSFAPAILTALVIAALTFVPVFGFGGETGRLLRPLAFTKTLVILAAVIVALTAAPALRERLLRGGLPAEMANPLTRALIRLYRPFVHFALARPAFTLLTAALAVLSCVPILSHIGSEFLPRVDEGDLLFMPTTLAGVDAEPAAMQLGRMDRAIRSRGEVATVLGKVGRAETATDPAPLSMAESVIRLKPRDQWPKIAHHRWYSVWAPPAVKPLLRAIWPEESPATNAELIALLDHATELPGWINAWTAPGRARQDMMSTGVRTPVGIRIVARDVARLDLLGGALRAQVAEVPGTRSAVYESLGGETRLQFNHDPEALRLHRVDVELVRATADLVISGGQVGEVEGGGNTGATTGSDGGRPPGAHRRWRVRVLPDTVPVRARDLRRPAELLREATVRSTAALDRPSQVVPLALLGRPGYFTSPSALRAERGELVSYVYVDVEDGADLLGYVERARRQVEASIASGTLHLQAGERIEWTGQYDLLLAGQRRLKVIAPIVALSMLALLVLQFRSLIEALIVLASVPFALVGSFWMLFLLQYRLSAPVWVGLLSVVGLAMQTGMVMVVYIDEAFHRRVATGRVQTRDDIIAAHAEGTVRRLRPKLMTIATMAAGLLPLLWAEGAGAEIIRRVAAPMVGGLATSAFLTLEVLPVLYTLWRQRQLARAHRMGIPLSEIVGEAPAWARR